jgi:hypothetical protein
MGRRHIPGMKPATLIIEYLFWFVKRGKESVPTEDSGNPNVNGRNMSLDSRTC